ncbi:hypothetical protein FHR81_002874 [Actinoalloteichus hoggarensis]|uniref:Uncharacterized protein n=1 Tax=Actinoalloteichus hoggarensis TaxID=1470176 RepID=A0A221VY93_9PSEU|nr:hypothetical protein [Actinoalloteichus hoggarensis]ASO18467.1 hypothetical protein AHOG_04055 [Actinoalloteichus hoggarensis]MBB5921834.1 hypothetical protein [Actinoalloteichus hoggarensis]
MTTIGRSQPGGASLPGGFDAVIEPARRLLRPEVRFVPEYRVNGVVAMTSDDLAVPRRLAGSDNV